MPPPQLVGSIEHGGCLRVAQEGQGTGGPQAVFGEEKPSVRARLCCLPEPAQRLRGAIDPQRCPPDVGHRGQRRRDSEPCADVGDGRGEDVVGALRFVGVDERQADLRYDCGEVDERG